MNNDKNLDALYKLSVFYNALYKTPTTSNGKASHQVFRYIIWVILGRYI